MLVLTLKRFEADTHFTQGISPKRTGAEPLPLAASKPETQVFSKNPGKAVIR
jgi:hypothetical protein